MSPSSISWSKVRERGGGVLFALALNALLLLALLTMGIRPERKEEPRNPVSFVLAPGPEASKQKAEKRKSERRREERSAERQAVPQKRPQPFQKLTEKLPSPSPFLELDSAQMASADIGRLPKGDESAGAAGTGDSAAAAGPGEGPGGVQLFDAEWYRRPTHAELATYLPGNAPAQGWGLVACKTVDDFHVENCQALGESPVGSGFARAVRLAAWQFLVRPPRVNGKPMVGSWVRIRIDYSRSVAGG